MPEFQPIGTITEHLFTSQTDQPQPKRPASADFWRDLDKDLKAARTPEEQEAVWQRYTAEQANARPTRRQRRGSTLEPVKFRPLDRNQRARLIFLAERLDANTRKPRQHGGCLKRTGLQVLRVLLFHFHNVATGRCDPSLDTIAAAAGMARSTVVDALKRLETAGILERIRRARWIRQAGRKRCVQWSNAYLLNVPTCYRQDEGNFAVSAPATASESGNRPPTTSAHNNKLGSGGYGEICPELQRALARLGNAIADKAEAENPSLQQGVAPA
jgi:DNA-binding MarR family transcriptional regulator